MQNNPDAVREAMRIAQSDAGQQLLQMLQQNSGPQLDQAMNQAISGDLRGAKALLSSLMKDPRAMELLKQMGGSYGSAGR